MRYLILIILFLICGCSNSNNFQFVNIEIDVIDSIIVDKISQEDFHSIENSYKLNQRQRTELITKFNNLKGGTPWLFKPEYIIKIYQSDSLRTFRLLRSKITERGDLALDLKDDTLIQKLIKLN